MCTTKGSESAEVYPDTIDWEIFVAEEFLSITFNDENETDEIFFSQYKWSMFILSNGLSAENKAW